MKVMKKLPVDRVVDVKCDVCRQSCKRGENIEFATLRASWGYESSMDSEQHECHLCEDCYGNVRGFIEGLGGEIRISDAGMLWQTPNG